MAEERKRRMSIVLDADVAADLLELASGRKVAAVRSGAPTVTIGDVASEALRLGMKEMRKKRR